MRDRKSKSHKNRACGQYFCLLHLDYLSALVSLVYVSRAYIYPKLVIDSLCYNKHQFTVPTGIFVLVCQVRAELDTPAWFSESQYFVMELIFVTLFNVRPMPYFI